MLAAEIGARSKKGRGKWLIALPFPSPLGPTAPNRDTTENHIPGMPRACACFRAVLGRRRRKLDTAKGFRKVENCALAFDAASFFRQFGRDCPGTRAASAGALTRG